MGLSEIVWRYDNAELCAPIIYNIFHKMYCLISGKAIEHVVSTGECRDDEKWVFITSKEADLT